MTKPLLGEVWRVKLYPVRGSEQDGMRPCLVVSPNTMNKALQTVIVVPLTRATRDWPTRVSIAIDHTPGQACLEHIRAVSKERFVTRLAKVSEVELATVQKHLVAMFQR